MAKRRATIEAVLPPRHPGIPAYRWLGDALRSAIVERRLRPGTRLPATRDLAAQYGLSRGTVVAAFDDLIAEGYLETRTGAGTFVTHALDERDAVPTGRGAIAAPIAPRARSSYASRLTAFPTYAPIASRAFRPNLPALDLFPSDRWARIYARRVRGGDPMLLMGCDAAGYAPLREAIADYVNASRGVRCSADRVIIVSGVQEALELTARILVNPGDRACVERPGYEGALTVLRAAGAEIVRAEIDAEGMRVDARALANVRLAYVTPAHQFPLGVTMSLARRAALLAWARDAGATIFEDDYDSEFRYHGRPHQALQGLDEHDRVIFAGSFSKVLFPSLRLGYVVVPDDLRDAFAAAKSVTTRHAQLLDQAALCDFMTDGHFARHVRRMRDVYAERLGALLASSHALLGDRLEVSSIDAGLQTIGRLAPGIDAAHLAARAESHAVDLRPLDWNDGARATLLLGFAAVDPDEIRRGITVIAKLLRA